MAFGISVPSFTRAPRGKPKRKTGPPSRRVTPTSQRASGVDTSRRDRDPNYRSKLPDSALTPSQLRARKLNARLAAHDKNPLYDPNAPLTGRTLLGSARTLAGLEIDPTVKALEREGKSATTQGTALIKHAGDYYRQLAEADEGTVNRQQALSMMLNAGVNGVGDQMQANLAAIGDKEGARAAQDAELRGSLGADGRVSEQIAFDRATGAMLDQQARTSALRQGGDWEALARAAAQARGMRGGELSGQLTNRLANTQGDIREKITDEEAKRGPLTTKNLLELRQQGFENMAIAKEFGLKEGELELAGAKVKADASEAAAARQFRRQEILIKAGYDPYTGKKLPAKGQSGADRLAQLKADYFKKHGKMPPTAQTPKPPGSVKEPASAISLRQNIDTVTGQIGDLRSMKGFPKGGSRLAKRNYVQKVIRDRARRAGKVIPNYILGAATDLALDGHVSKRNARILRSYGVQIPGTWR